MLIFFLRKKDVHSLDRLTSHADLMLWHFLPGTPYIPPLLPSGDDRILVQLPHVIPSS